MRELPVQHRADAVRSDDQVAVAEIAMHQRHFRGRTGIVVAQPAQRQLEYGLWLVQAAIVALELRDLLGRMAAAQLRQLVLGQPVQARKHASDLAR